MEMKIKKERESGIELLRIFAALSVVILHYCFPGAFDALRAESDILPFNKTLLLGILECISICAVNVFIIITGYFLSTSERRSIGKPFGLLLQLVVINLGVWLFGTIMGEHPFSIQGLIITALPRSYFVSLYISLYLVSPYLNVIIHKLSIYEWKVFFLIVLSLFSVWEILVNIGDDLVNANLATMSAISHWGGGCGHTIVNFSLLYFIGAFLRKYHIQMGRVKSFLAFWFTTLLILVWFLLEVQHKSGIINYTFGYYYNPLVILQSVLIFLFFSKLNFKSHLVNEFAKAAFTCYIINRLLLSKIGGGEAAVRLSTIHLFFFIIIGAVATYFIAYLLYKLFALSTNWFLVKLNRYDIKYWDKMYR